LSAWQSMEFSAIKARKSALLVRLTWRSV